MQSRVLDRAKRACPQASISTSKYIPRAVLPPPLDASSVARWPKLVLYTGPTPSLPTRVTISFDTISGFHRYYTQTKQHKLFIYLLVFAHAPPVLFLNHHSHAAYLPRPWRRLHNIKLFNLYHNVTRLPKEAMVQNGKSGALCQPMRTEGCKNSSSNFPV